MTWPASEAGLPSVPSDTICFPAKLAHGHVKDLITKKVDRIFMPMMIKVPAECGAGAGSHSCAVVQGYPLVVDETEEPERENRRVAIRRITPLVAPVARAE